MKMYIAILALVACLALAMKAEARTVVAYVNGRWIVQVVPDYPQPQPCPYHPPCPNVYPYYHPPVVNPYYYPPQPRPRPNPHYHPRTPTNHNHHRDHGCH